MEPVIKKKMFYPFLSNNVLCPNQHGFVEQKSTITNLVESTLDWAYELDASGCVYLLHIDLKKAFDSIVHFKLIVKLERLGFCYELLSWLSEFLTGRIQCVQFNGHVSETALVCRRVLHGSVIYIIFKRFTSISV